MAIQRDGILPDHPRDSGQRKRDRPDDHYEHSGRSEIHCGIRSKQSDRQDLTALAGEGAENETGPADPVVW